MTIRFRLIKNFSNIYSFQATTIIICNAMCSVNIGFTSIHSLSFQFSLILTHTRFTDISTTRYTKIIFLLHLTCEHPNIINLFYITFFIKKILLLIATDRIKLKKRVIWFCFIPLFIIWSKAYQSLTHFLWIIYWEVREA